MQRNKNKNFIHFKIQYKKKLFHFIKSTLISLTLNKHLNLENFNLKNLLFT